MRRSSKGLVTITCDVTHPCEGKFQTYSMAAVARTQARLHGGFLRTKLNRIADWWTLGKGSRGSKALDACGECKAKLADKAIRVPKENRE